jgi:hypothetical protein
MWALLGRLFCCKTALRPKSEKVEPTYIRQPSSHKLRSRQSKPRRSRCCSHNVTAVHYHCCHTPSRWTKECPCASSEHAGTSLPEFEGAHQNKDTVRTMNQRPKPEHSIWGCCEPLPTPVSRWTYTAKVAGTPRVWVAGKLNRMNSFL